MIRFPKPDARDLQMIFKTYHSGNFEIDDWRLDELLGIKPSRVEREINKQQLIDQLGDEQFAYEGTPYGFIRDFLKSVNPQKEDVVYDMGSGYGRIVFYGALTSAAKYVGIEIVPERVWECRVIQQRHNINNANFIEGNVLDQDFSCGTIFFLFNPFSHRTLESTVAKLRQISIIRKIKIVSWGGPSERYLREQNWLRDITPDSRNMFSQERLQFFMSK